MWVHSSLDHSEEAFQQQKSLYVTGTQWASPIVTNYSKMTINLFFFPLFFALLVFILLYFFLLSLSMALLFFSFISLPILYYPQYHLLYCLFFNILFLINSLQSAFVPMCSTLTVHSLKYLMSTYYVTDTVPNATYDDEQNKSFWTQGGYIIYVSNT